jgi:hypothetical protein
MNEAIQILGCLLLAGAAGTAFYRLIKKDSFDKGTITVLALFGVLGVALIVSPRLEELTGLGFRIKAATEKAEGSAERLASLEAEARKQTNIIHSAATNAERSIFLFQQLSNKVAELNYSSEQAKAGLNELNKFADFSSLIMRAQNQSREALCKLLFDEKYKKDYPYVYNIALQIVIKQQKLLSDWLRYKKNDADPFSYQRKPTKAAEENPAIHAYLENFFQGYDGNDYWFTPRYDIIRAAFESKHLSDYQKYELLHYVIANDTDAVIVEEACAMMIPKVPLASVSTYERCLRWFEVNKDTLSKVPEKLPETK